jgi:ATP-dependent Clp protease adaptor protein ClpS
MASDPTRRDDGVVVVPVPVPERKVERARRFRVVFYNDDYTTKWFVVHVLEAYFHMTEANATAFMLVVHQTGRGVAGVYSRDVAETKVAEVHELAKEYEMPLKLDVEPDDDD